MRPLVPQNSGRHGQTRVFTIPQTAWEQEPGSSEKITGGLMPPAIASAARIKARCGSACVRAAAMNIFAWRCNQRGLIQPAPNSEVSVARGSGCSERTRWPAYKIISTGTRERFVDIRQRLPYPFLYESIYTPDEQRVPLMSKAAVGKTQAKRDCIQILELERHQRNSTRWHCCRSAGYCA